MKLKFILIITLALSMTSCSLFDFLDNKGKEPSGNNNLTYEQIAHRKDVHDFMDMVLDNIDINNVTEDNITEVISYLNGMPDVANAFLSGSNDIIITMDWGDFFVYVLNPDPDWIYDEDIENENMSTILSCDESLASGSRASANIMNGKKVAICIGPDIKQDYINMIDDVAAKYEKAGFEVVTYKDEIDNTSGQKVFNLEFIQNEVVGYDVVLIVSHGGYNRRSGEHFFDVNEEDKDRNFFSRYIYGKEYKIVKEGDWPKSNFKDNSIVFLVSCGQLEGNDNLAKNLLSKNVGAFLAFDATVPCKAGLVMLSNFTDYLLNGYTVQQAYDYMPINKGSGTISGRGIFIEYNLILNGNKRDIQIINKKPEERKLEVSLSWNFFGDIDLHCVSPNGHLCWYNTHITDAYLDRDNTEGGEASVENMYWSNVVDGTYEFYLHYYRKQNGGKCYVKIRYGDTKMNYENIMYEENQIAKVTTITIKDGKLLNETRCGNGEISTSIFDSIPHKN